MVKVTLCLYFLIFGLFLGNECGVLNIGSENYGDSLRSFKVYETLLGVERRPLLRRKIRSNYITDLYKELASENNGDVYNNGDDHNTTLLCMRGYFENRNYITFSIKNKVHSRIDRLEFAVLVTGRIRSEITESANVTININNRDQIAQILKTKLGKIYLIVDISYLTGKLQSLTVYRHMNINNKKVRISETNEPVSVAFQGSANNPLLQPRHPRVRRGINSHMSALYSSDKRRPAGNILSCGRYNWSIDMKIFEFNWYIEPRYFQAGICKGLCETPLTSSRTNSTNYSYIKNLWHVHTSFSNLKEIPRACCTPIEYMPLWMLLVDNDGEIAAKYIPNMRVKSCGCR